MPPPVNNGRHGQSRRAAPPVLARTASDLVAAGAFAAAAGVVLVGGACPCEAGPAQGREGPCASEGERRAAAAVGAFGAAVVCWIGAVGLLELERRRGALRRRGGG